MENKELKNQYMDIYDILNKIVKESESRAIKLDADHLFFDNINFFVKLYLINICTYLEAYLQDVVFEYARNINERIVNSKIPKNYVYWKIKKEVKHPDLKYEILDLSVDKDEISGVLSGNPDKTIKMFRYIGIDLMKFEGFKDKKDIVGTVVKKRNQVIHQNDKAVDISFSDLQYYIDSFKSYIEAINLAVCSS